MAGIRSFQFCCLLSVPTPSRGTAQRWSVAVPACAVLDQEVQILDLLSWPFSEVFSPGF